MFQTQTVALPADGRDAVSGLQSLLDTLQSHLEEGLQVQPVELNPLFLCVSRFLWPSAEQKARALDDCEALECYLRLGDARNAQRSIATLHRRLVRAEAARSIRLANAAAAVRETGEGGENNLAV